MCIRDRFDVWMFANIWSTADNKHELKLSLIHISTPLCASSLFYIILSDCWLVLFSLHRRKMKVCKVLFCFGKLYRKGRREKERRKWIYGRSTIRFCGKCTNSKRVKEAIETENGRSIFYHQTELFLVLCRNLSSTFFWFLCTLWKLKQCEDYTPSRRD